MSEQKIESQSQIDSLPQAGNTAPVKRAIPEDLRKKLSEAGKKGAKKLTFEDRSRGGKHGWETRLKNAKQDASETKEPNATRTQPNPTPTE